LLGDGFDAIADLRPGVGRDRVLHHPLVVVDEQPRRREVGGLPGLDAVELDRSRDRVGRTAADPALVVGREGNLRTQIDRWRQLLQMLQRRRVHKIAMVGQVGNPPEPKASSCRGGHFTLPGVVEP
jgi:hypothetical protein